MKRYPDPWSLRLLGWLIARLPSHLQQGKMPYVIWFGVTIFCTMALIQSITPYAQTPGRVLLGAIAAFLMAAYLGLSLRWLVHLGMTAGAAILGWIVWHSGGIYSPRIVWLMALPLTPFYTLGRQAGFFWLGIVLLMQLIIALATGLRLLPAFELGQPHVLHSTLTYGLVTVLVLIVPLIYARLNRRTLQISQQDQHELEAQRTELEQILHMRDLFIATVSHELRTPMNAILGFNDLLLTQVQDRAEARKVLQHTRQSADHLMTVINDILDYSQLQAGQLQIHQETFDLHQLLQHAFELFLPRVRSSRLDYRIEIAPEVPRWVHSDRHRIMQVLVNLLGNALKFTHQGSVVLRVEAQPQGVLLSVQDTGIGIAPERQTHIFSRFTQAAGDIQSRYGGNGLGLAISRQLVTRLGGTIGFESEPGRGSRFWFSLPLQACQPPAQNLQHTAAQLQTRERAWRLLIVDDHPVNRLLVRRMLEQAWPQANIHEAADGQAALTVLRQQPVDLVLMDQVMPVMDGIEATRAIRAEPAWRALPVLGLTANVNPVDLAAFRAAGLNEVLLKPFEPGPLTLKIEHWLLQYLQSGASAR